MVTFLQMPSLLFVVAGDVLARDQTTGRIRLEEAHDVVKRATSRRRWANAHHLSPGDAVEANVVEEDDPDLQMPSRRP